MKRILGFGRLRHRSKKPHRGGLGKSKPKVRSIVFEGGLGSQILPMLETAWLVNQELPFFVDVNYFKINEKIQNLQGGADHWSFKLDRYGHSLHKIGSLGIQDVDSIDLIPGRNFDLWTNSFWRYSRKIGDELFPINHQSVIDFKASVGLPELGRFSLIHVRRGDYVRVASRLVSDYEWLHALTNLIPEIKEHLLISSDSAIPSDTKREVARICNPYGVEVIYLEGGEFDECDLHDLMRLADILVTSNSTFSFTAAILSKKDSKSYIPNVFYGDEELEEINRGFRSAGTFFLLD